MAGGVFILGSLASYPIILLGAFILGALSGPVSALLGFFVLDRIPEEKRGVALGTQNSLMLIAAPFAIFISSIIVSALGAQTASWILVGVCIIMTVFALAMKSMKKLDDPLKEAPGGLAEQAVSQAE
jgi:MFS family permease